MCIPITDEKVQCVGSMEYGVRVRVLGMHPSATPTDRIIELNKTMAKQNLGDESRWEERLKLTRLTEPEQVADTMLFFASGRANHLSGGMLNLGTS